MGNLKTLYFITFQAMGPKGPVLVDGYFEMEAEVFFPSEAKRLFIQRYPDLAMSVDNVVIINHINQERNRHLYEEDVKARDKLNADLEDIRNKAASGKLSVEETTRKLSTANKAYVNGIREVSDVGQ